MSAPITLEALVKQSFKAGAVMSISLEPLEGRKYHRASKVNVKTGQASALCYRTPKAIPKHERWTLRDEAVTCKRCLTIIKKQSK